MSSRAGAALPMLEARVGPARVWCTGRAQGNVGDHVGDDPAVVAHNRAALRPFVGVDDDSRWAWVRQVHGTTVHVVSETRGATRGALVAPAAAAPIADAVVTTVAGVALAIVTADCAPLVLACDGAVGVVHAGHRGLADGVIEATITTLRDLGTGETHAFLGPCIRVGSYEFGAADLTRFVERFGPGVAGRTRAGRPALDIPAVIRVILDREGVVDVDDSGVDTAESEAYFSYRRERETGRQATIAVLA